MKSLMRSALLGVAGLAALSLSAHAAGTTAVTGTPAFKSSTPTKLMQMARDENPGGGGAFKQSKKKAK